ncbi:MAG: hypothetical protein J7L83_01445 [Thaumarchaeota archaeon]|nr:hypothetical protein [Nitrososphaerota archaeon]
MSKMEFDVIVVHYGEVTLKRSKRGLFEKILARNLEKSSGMKVKRLQGRLIIELTPKADLTSLLDKIGKVFGVVWYAPAIKVKTVEDLQERIVKILRGLKVNKIGIETRRSDKSFPMTSLEISKIVGAHLSAALGVKIDLKNPEKKVFIEVTEDGIYASFERLRGPGGLPIGSSGKVLCLFSGGIRSWLACWYIMKRGCSVDLLHIYNASSPERFLEAAAHLINKLLEYSMKFRLYLIPFNIVLKILEEVPENMREIVFKIYLHKIGEKIAERRRYPGLVSGYTIGLDQVRFNELYLLLSLRKLPIYTPLIALDESEIINRARSLRLPEIPGEEYLDPAEYLRRNFGTAEVDRDRVKDYLKKLKLDDAVERSMSDLQVLELKFGEKLKPKT